MTLQDRVSSNVRVLAAAAGTSPSAVAESVGRSRQWIQAKLSGRIGWSLGDVERVSEGLGVEPGVLMTTDWWPAELRACRDSNPKPSDLWRVAA
jgi:Helix-turn-helix domain